MPETLHLQGFQALVNRSVLLPLDNSNMVSAIYSMCFLSVTTIYMYIICIILFYSNKIRQRYVTVSVPRVSYCKLIEL